MEPPGAPEAAPEAPLPRAGRAGLRVLPGGAAPAAAKPRVFKLGISPASVSRHKKALAQGRIPGKPGRPTTLTPAVVQQAQEYIRTHHNIRLTQFTQDMSTFRLTHSRGVAVDHAQMSRATAKKLIQVAELKTCTAVRVEEDHVQRGRLVRHFFRKCEHVFGGPLDQLFDEDLVFNMDESMVTSGVPRGAKYVVLLHSQRKPFMKYKRHYQHHTVLCCISAGGEALPPLLIFPRATQPKDLPKLVHDYFGESGTKKGWVNQTIFLKYLREMLIPQKACNPRPALVVLDRCTSHFAPGVHELVVGPRPHLPPPAATACTTSRLTALPLRRPMVPTRPPSPPPPPLVHTGTAPAAPHSVPIPGVPTTRGSEPPRSEAAPAPEEDEETAEEPDGPPARDPAAEGEAAGSDGGASFEDEEEPEEAPTRAELEELLRQEQVTLLFLPPGMTPILQPLDLTYFSHFKRVLTQNVDKIGKYRPKYSTRARLITACRDSLMQASGSTTILAGWHRSGLYPYAPDRPLGSEFVEPETSPPPDDARCGARPRVALEPPRKKPASKARAGPTPPGKVTPTAFPAQAMATAAPLPAGWQPPPQPFYGGFGLSEKIPTLPGAAREGPQNQISNVPALIESPILPTGHLSTLGI
ncbi:hypothetical protein PAPYR_11136 [Paratrimastix pyriformis]|uniref:DDE-1 domain-containing protein n=1 Tax=Paratrimastix pyriformis TaxID=342808 RepID=A0ABQ8UA61_9EUKA|nr:hypothetical protein PAPYR_11136 [Paratrimastix pyriformis]